MRTHTCIYIYIFVYIVYIYIYCICIYVYIYISIYASKCVYININVYIYMYIYIYICKYIYIYICMCVCIIYLYMYVHSHSNSFSWGIRHVWRHRRVSYMWNQAYLSGSFRSQLQFLLQFRNARQLVSRLPDVTIPSTCTQPEPETEKSSMGWKQCKTGFNRPLSDFMPQTQL